MLFLGEDYEYSVNDSSFIHFVLSVNGQYYYFVLLAHVALFLFCSVFRWGLWIFCKWWFILCCPWMANIIFCVVCEQLILCFVLLLKGFSLDFYCALYLHQLLHPTYRLCIRPTLHTWTLVYPIFVLWSHLWLQSISGCIWYYIWKQGQRGLGSILELCS